MYPKCYHNEQQMLDLDYYRNRIIRIYTFSGKGAHLTAVPVSSPSSPKLQAHNRTFSQPHNEKLSPSYHSLAYTNAAVHTRSLSESGCENRNGKLQEQHCHTNGGTTVHNGCLSTRENLLAKTDVAMASLLVRLDQVAAQCSAAQIHGGGKLISEEKFQVNHEQIIFMIFRIVFFQSLHINLLI